MPAARPAVEPSVAMDDDVVVLLEACTAALDARVLDAVRAAAGAQVRFADGYVFQHLLAGPVSVSELARRLGVSQQAASKQVADLEQRGLVRRRPDPADGRSRLVVMAARGQRAVDASRTARAELAAEVETLLGPADARRLVVALGRISDATGALDAMRRRRLRPEVAR